MPKGEAMQAVIENALQRYQKQQKLTWKIKRERALAAYMDDITLSRDLRLADEGMRGYHA